MIRLFIFLLKRIAPFENRFLCMVLHVQNNINYVYTHMSKACQFTFLPEQGILKRSDVIFLSDLKEIYTD